MLFHETLALIENDKNNQTIKLPEGWAQGRAFFGGFSAALAAQFLLRQFPGDYHLRSLAISFVAPATPGDATLSYRVLRQGSSVLQVSVEITQNDEVMLAGLASLGKGRSSSVSVSGETPPDLKTINDGPGLPEADIVPEFAKNFDYRITSGGMPFSGQPGRTFGGWIRFRKEQQELTTAAVLALVDAWPPAVLPHLDSPAPASSLTWTIEFPDLPLDEFNTNDWFQYEAFIEHAEHGYGHSRAGLWSEEGKLLAISRQSFTVFA
ncbi:MULTISPECIES: thioesterase family protein [Idiomarina]|jgi:acyl-CoA thioesterase|uniref:thioesterase family protein n=1 Tax=Idiomarina TaxID=135575 RepID=UPI000C41362A|nr:MULTISPECIES: thioesterase family protein [Idiomarina]MAB22486.1 acyl-CoA thioesterase [Idiomarina sp.]MBH95353.1 acyl-CoA thioesterase [Idiomarina sp.]QZN89844.1 thioesterase family protein [Idiomarina abyssalis]|tara:strand:- start:3965 stop:4759 length:795 start_codon:yes stop_codon:yes gene_type:complete